MKITTENDVKQYILDRINKVCILFDDDIEVKLNQIVEYDIDLDNIDMSIVSFSNALFDKEIENRFKNKKSNNIIHIHIEAIGCLCDACESIKVFYDIPCDMKIRKFRMNGIYRETISNMFFELEGCIK